MTSLCSFVLMLICVATAILLVLKMIWFGCSEHEVKILATLGLTAASSMMVGIVALFIESCNTDNEETTNENPSGD